MASSSSSPTEKMEAAFVLSLRFYAFKSNFDFFSKPNQAITLFIAYVSIKVHKILSFTHHYGPTGNSTVSGERKPIKKTVATSATAKPNGKSTASSVTVMKPNETTAVSSANSMNPNAVGAVKPEDSSASGVTQKPSPPVGSPAQGSVVVAQTSPGASSVRSVPSTIVKKKPDVVPARQTTSISLRDDSDDDDLDGDMETADNGDPTDVKRARRNTWVRRPFRISGFTNRNVQKISPTPKAVRVIELWPIISEANDLHGTGFLCFSLEGETLEGQLSRQLSTTNPNLLSAVDIYQLSDYMVIPNNRRHKLTPQPFFIRINREASVIKLEHTISGFPAQKFSSLNFMQLIDSATARTYLPDVVGQILIMQDDYPHYPEYQTKLIIGLRINGWMMVKLTLWGNEASLFRQLQAMSHRKYKVVLVTSIIPSICKGKLLLASSSATQFFFDENIKHISGFRSKISIGGE
ncbi:unnamed protein product [Brassica napus]|uniref:(rape) hypothetical protein n=1 Tax=Brassica napus TaxID=3708 RepID=A0A816P8W6_BRANA|nr:unnamed protein product [Brassica napus]